MSLFKTYFLLLTLAISTLAMGQAARSPFSTFGIGEPYGNALIHNQGMGGIGVAQPQPWFINNQNPALLAYNYLTVFQAGVVGENRTISNDTLSVENGNGNLNYLVTAFPVKRGRWSTSIGLMPFSRVNYKLQYEQPFVDVNNNEIDSLRVTVTEQGSGGLSQLYWANGVRINDDWAVGIKASYLFSSIKTDFSFTQPYPLDQPIPYTIGSQDQIYVRDFMLTGGISFSKDSLFKSNDYRISVGLVYNFKADLRSELTNFFQRRATTGQVVTSDTLGTQRGSIVIPASFTVGASISKGSKWNAGAEFSAQDWTNYESSFSTQDDEMGKSWKFAFGGEFTPDAFAGKNLLKRVTYRAGLSYEQYPYLIESPTESGTYNQLKDFGINFGFSVPTGRSSLDFAFRVGKRGDIAETVLEETYYKVYFGITFNDQWFIRRKFD